MKQSTGIVQAYEPKQKTFKILKKKLVLGLEKDVWTQAGSSKSHEHYQKLMAKECQQNFESGSTEAISTTSEIDFKGIMDSITYFQQQEKMLQSLIMTEKQLQ